MMVDFWDPYGEPPEPPERFDFMEDCKIEEDGLPPVENLQTACGHGVPERSPAMIDGVLRKGHKMLLAGPSKAGKSFALIELCIAIAEGGSWLGQFSCAQGKVLYINLELDRASCLHRFKDVYTALGLAPENLANIDIWNLRGASVPMDKLAPKLIRRAKKKGYTAVILDPIYKVITGDENSADQMAKFCNQFDLVCRELDCAVIYCHHHSKGAQGGKRSMDRASGSGVFARDVDALLDVIELELPPDRRQAGVTAWRIEGTLREFPSFEPVDVWFNYPIHVMERFDPADNIAPHSQLPAFQRAMNARKPKEQKLKERRHRLEAAIDVLAAQGVEVTTSNVAEYLDVTNKTIRYMVDEHPRFERDTKTGQIRRAHTVAPQE